MDMPWQQSISNTLSTGIGLGVLWFVEEIHYSMWKNIWKFWLTKMQALVFLTLFVTHIKLHHQMNPCSKCTCCKVWAELIFPSALVNLTNSLETSWGQQCIHGTSTHCFTSLQQHPKPQDRAELLSTRAWYNPKTRSLPGYLQLKRCAHRQKAQN